MMGSLNTPIASWSGKRIWIIGASSGIGAALAQSLLRAGASVAVSARRETELTAVIEGHPKAAAVVLDVSRTEDWRPALESVVNALGGLDLVVMSAARYDPMHSWDIDLAKVQQSFDLNVVSLYKGLAVVVPHLLAQRFGGIALIGSISGYTGLPKALVYGATKASLNNLAETLYFELAPKGLNVYLVNPGFVATPMTAGNDFDMPGLMTPEEAAQQIKIGLEKGRFEIRFPKGFANGLRWISRLPYRWRFPLLHKATGL